MSTTSSPTAQPLVVVTGATGFIGTALVARLRAAGARVRRVTRGGDGRDPDDIVWDPMRDVLPARELDGADAVVNLAGAPIARRWTASRKRAIRESRRRGTELLARTLATLERKPRVLVSGSAVGYYGDRGDESLDETSAPGTDFLAQVAREWEEATAPAREAGVRVVLTRTGIVLGAHAGALEQLMLPFRFGVGGRIGSGRQWMSWIALDDELGAIEHALATDGLHGPANLVSPNPVTNTEFAATLGRVLGRPAAIPAPAFAVEMAFGEMARTTILAGQRAYPGALLRTGFHFRHPTLEQALRFELAR